MNGGKKTKPSDQQSVDQIAQIRSEKPVKKPF